MYNLFFYISKILIYYSVYANAFHNNSEAIVKLKQQFFFLFQHG